MPLGGIVSQEIRGSNMKSVFSLGSTPLLESDVIQLCKFYVLIQNYEYSTH